MKMFFLTEIPSFLEKNVWAFFLLYKTILSKYFNFALQMQEHAWLTKCAFRWSLGPQSFWSINNLNKNLRK